MGEKKRIPFNGKMGRKPVDPSEKKKILSITMDPKTLQWVKEWSAKRGRSVSWSVQFFIQERRNRELAELHLGQKIVRRRPK